MKVRIGFEVTEFQGVLLPLEIFLEKSSHWLITGGSGSGKSVLLLYALNSVLNAPICLYIGSFKGEDSFLGITENYAEFGACVDLVENFYSRYQEIKQNRTNDRILLVFDEWAGFLIWLEGTDKKKATEIKNKMAEILMQGRSLPGGGSAWFWCVCQRADSTYFSHGARDNYMVSIGMGRLSKESKGMLFPGEEIPEDYTPCTGRGLILEDGKNLRIFQVPQIDKTRLKRLLLKKAKQRAGEAGE